MPAARRFIVEHAINEVIDGDATDLRELGLIVQGGLTHTLLRAMAEAGLTDGQDRPRLALLVLNCVYPLVPEQIVAFCSGRRAVLVLEEGQPDYIEQDIATTLRRAGVSTPLHGKDLLSMGGEYNAELLLGGLMRLLQAYRLDAEAGPARARLAALEVLRQTHYAAGDALHQRQGELADAALEVSRLEERIRYVVEGRQRSRR